DQIRLSKVLVTLKHDVPVEEKWESFAVRDPDPSMLLQFLDAMEFRTLSRRARESYAREKGAEIVASYAAGAAAPAVGAVVEEVEREFKREAYRCGRNLSELEQFVARARAAGVVGLDTEADAIDAAGAELVGFSLAAAPNDAIYVPLGHRGADPRAGELFASEAPDTSLAADTGPQIPRAAALAAVHALLEDP